jgi:peptidoglycan/xylan/chitin deacetylase (PgdA/CDA1 family)
MTDPARCVAVMYHYVRDRTGTSEADLCGLSPTAFERQLDQLCDRLEPIDWSALRHWLHDGRAIPDDAFLLTFDDGLADHAEIVAPILERRGLRAAFFVQGEVLDTGRIAPNHQAHLLRCRLGDDGFTEAVDRWLTDHAPDALTSDRVDFAEARRIYHYETPPRAAFKYRLSHVLPPELHRSLLDDLFARHVGDPCEWAKRWYMDRNDLRHLEAAGHVVGGHGYAHAFYTRMTESQIRLDVARTASVLHRTLGWQPRPFSYPYGSWTVRAAECCANAGFVHAFGTRPGWINGSTERYDVPRVDTIDVTRFLEQETPCPSP